MRVLLSAYACEPGRGSEPGTGWHWAHSLAMQGHDVTVLTRPDGRASIERELHADTNPNLKFMFVRTPDSLATNLRGNAGVYAKYLAWQRAAYVVARTVEDGFDVVHHVSWGSLMGGSQLWRLGAPLVYGPVGGGQRVPSSLKSLVRTDGLRQTVRAANLSLAKWAPKKRFLSHAAAVLATNGETYDLAKTLGATKVDYFVDSGLTAHFMSNAPVTPSNKGPLRVLWVGRLVPRKALLLSIQAISLTRQEVELTVVGDGPDRIAAETLSSQLGLGARIKLVGRVPWSEMPLWYRSHDVFLFSSVLDSFGGQLLEAMAAGLPIVTLNHQGAKTFVPENAGMKIQIAPPNELAADVAKALDTLATNLELRQRMGIASWEYANTESWPARAERMTDIYEQVTSRASL